MKALKIVGIALGVLVLLAVGGLAYVVYRPGTWRIQPRPAGAGG